jgi:hypothetical protein
MAVVSAFSALEETVVTMGCDDSTGISAAAVVGADAETGASTDEVAAGRDSGISESRSGRWEVWA